MFAGFVIGLTVGLFIAVFVYMYMDSKIYRLRNQVSNVLKRKLKCPSI